MSQQANILVIDDEQVIRLSCIQILEPQEMVVDYAENGIIGLAKLQDKAYDVVLVDLMMPQMSGMEVLEAIRKIDQSIIAIIITGYATIESAVEAVKKGAYDYLPKPFTPDELRRVVRKGLEKRQLILEAEQLRQERERNLLELATERSRIATIIDCMGEGLIVTNKNAQIVLLNSQAKDMLKIQDLSIISKSVKGNLNNNDLEGLIANTLKSEKVSSTIIKKEIVFDKKEGQIYQAVASTIYEEKGESLGLVIILRDISQEKKIDQTKSEFVRMVTHELKAPIGAIEGYLDLILDGMVEEDLVKQRELIEKSRNKASELLQLIRDLLNIFALEAGKVAQHIEPTEINTILNDVIDFMKNDADQKNISLIRQLQDEIPLVRADREDLNRVFTNLISNAIKYNKPEGEIRIKTETNGYYVVVSISDTGIGIKQENQQKIFDEFYRVNNEQTRGTSGTGLGLSIARKIIKSHSGYIEVQSEWGKGSTFKVYLPILNKK